MLTAAPVPAHRTRRLLATTGIILAVAAFCGVFLLVDGAYFRFANARFPNVGSSAALATLWGFVSRAHLLIVIVPLILWRPRQLGFRIGKIGQHWKMLLLMLLANCGVVAAFLFPTHSSTPYSGNQWLFTEIVTVPFVEESFWRGLVFMVLLAAFSKLHPDNRSRHLTVWVSGLAFGVLHAGNALAGVPVSFVVLQALSASV